ncbi:MAG: P-loop NTPase fold protein [Bacteroidales bacterium]|nr:P-loop NTPase fold protein [Bacteroidales bacterium]
MSIRHIEIKIEPEKPFANCKLGRQKHANVLTDIVNSYSDGFVLAINNKWGTGKTTFVKMWQQDLKDKKYQTVYFNAWENDFENNPLTALMGELKILTNESTEPKFKSTLKRAAILSKHIAPIVTQAIADKYVNTKEIKDAIVNLTKGLTDIFENDVNEYAKKKKGIAVFRESLSDFIASINQSKPLIFIIDELDRCRPDYAVSILEQIKHFFSVPNIVFILSIDKVQLGNAIRGVYGSDKIDADEYLRRFIDIEYSIPDPENGIFYKYLYDYFKFDDILNSAERKKYPELQTDKENFLRICKLLFTNTPIPLRQQEKILVLAKLSLRTFDDNQYVIPSVFLFLNFIKVIYNDFYEDLKYKRLSINQLQERFFEIIKPNKNEETERELMWLEGYLLNFYNNFLYTRFNRNKLYEHDKTSGKNKLKIRSIINEKAENDFLVIFENFDRGRNDGDLDLGYFLKRIDLLENLKL